jgi:SAM-dependent methyltransferase
LPLTNDRFERWLLALEQRHLADLTFREVSGALRALSSTYVERRQRLREGAALGGAGKRAAFALFYGPLHYLLLRAIVSELPGALHGPSRIVDLGCGTGSAGAACAVARAAASRVVGIDRYPWTLGEAGRTYREFGLTATTVQGDVARAALPKPPAMIVAAFLVNELPDSARHTLQQRLVERATRGDRVLVVEPLARFVAPWWHDWRSAFEAAGGRADEWRFRVELPDIVAKLDRAAGLNHRELTGRSLWLSRSA